MVTKLWLRRKLLKLKRKKWLKRKMEKSKDVKVFVTGVSMAGEIKLDEHNRTPEDNKEKPKREEIGDSREDD
jgi:hypothetical protein|tara:strand:- start:5345 stop:5560 length:216 start_codon:yes stop_codon:yes gene_type:complete